VFEMLPRFYKLLSRISILHWFFVYVFSIISTHILDGQIRENTGVSLVSDEGIYLAYSHMLSGSNLSDLEQQHIAGYGKFYWIRCFPLVFPASLLNRIGIDGVLSLRMVVWVIGFLGFYIFYTYSKKEKGNANGLAAIYFFLFPIAHMVRFFGIKETLISTNFLLFCVLLNRFYNKDLRLACLVRNVGSRYIFLTAISFLFLQSYYVLIIIFTFVIFSIFHKSLYLIAMSAGLFAIYLIFNFVSIQLAPNSDLKLDIVPTQRITSNEASSGQSFVPRSVISQAPAFLDSKLENLTGSKPAPDVMTNLKYLHLLYFNSSSSLSSLVSLESIMWLILLGMLTFKFIRLRRINSSSQIILLMLCFVSAGILLYDENFGTYLRHRDQILLAVLYFASLNHKKSET